MNKDFFQFIENKKSNKLVVIFSGVNAKSFMGYKLVEDFECNRIFIREENKSWYHSPIQNISNNIDELLTYIKNYTDKFETKNITFIGSSMGAYASLHIGITLKIGKIIAFGPQIIINKSLPNNPKDDNYIRYKNLTSIINTSKSSIDIFIGMNELADLYHVKDIKNNKNIKVYKIFGQPHNVMYFLHKINLLKEYIENKVFNKTDEIKILNNFKATFNKEKYLQNAVELFYFKNNYKDAKTMFEKLINLYPSINTFFKYAGICCFMQKDYDKAIQYFTKAGIIIFRDEELHYYLGLSYFNKKNYSFAQEEFRYAIEFSTDKKLSYFIKLATSLRELGKYEEGLSILEKSLKYNSKNFGTYYQMAEIYRRQNNLDKTLENLQIANKLNPNEKSIILEIQKLSK